MGPTLPKGTLEHLKTVTHQLAVDRVSFSLVEVDMCRLLVPIFPKLYAFGGGENRYLGQTGRCCIARSFNNM
jgi:hypothetical protein